MSAGVPDGWRISTIGQIASVRTGKTPSRTQPQYCEGTTPWVKTNEVRDGVIEHTEEHLSSEAIAEAHCEVYPAGSILVAMYGQGSTRGRTALLGMPAATNQACAVLLPSPSYDAKYLWAYLRASYKRLRDLGHGGNQPNLNLAMVRDFPVPLPPLPEQRRIAAILDKADAIRRKRQQTIRLTDEFLRSAFLDMFGDIPARKSRYRFGPIRPFVKANSGKSSKPVLSKTPTGIPVYGGNGINGWATKALYDQPVVVVGRVGQQCGITHLTEGPAWVTDNAIVVRVVGTDSIHPVYLVTALRNSPLRAIVQRFDLPFVNQSMVLDHPIPLPPLNAQLRYAALADTCFKSMERLQGFVAGADGLFAAMVHRAFRGEL